MTWKKSLDKRTGEFMKKYFLAMIAMCSASAFAMEYKLEIRLNNPGYILASKCDPSSECRYSHISHEVIPLTDEVENQLDQTKVGQEICVSGTYTTAPSENLRSTGLIYVRTIKQCK